MLVIDGSTGEGGGQILRTSLALALVTATPVRIEQIRAKRAKPGLLRQHLAAVKAAIQIGAAIEGAELGATSLVVRPGAVRGGEHAFTIGSAGSACLVLQTVLPALLAAGEPARLRLEGGTHNPFAPPFDYLERVFLPVLAQMGAKVTAVLERVGFYPAGGGAFSVEIERCDRLVGVELRERGALVAHLPGEIAKRELDLVQRMLGWDEAELQIEQVAGSAGPGNVLLLEVDHGGPREICTGFGEKSRRAEAVARHAIDQMRRFAGYGAPVGAHLADQLLVPFAIAGAGAFRTQPLSQHARTNLAIIERFFAGADRDPRGRSRRDARILERQLLTSGISKGDQ